MPDLCICKICTCGRHRCVHKAAATKTIPTDPKETGDFTTEMKKAYRPTGPQSRVTPSKPVSNLMNASGPMQKTTTTADDYTPKSITAKIVKPKRSYIPPTTKMYNRSTYRKDFCPEDGKPWPVREPLARGKENNLNVPKEKMETTTTQVRDYVQWNRKDADACRGRPSSEGRTGTLTVSGQEFKGQSETNRCFTKPPFTAPERGKCKPDHLYTGGHFEGKTTTNADYTPKKVIARVAAKGRKQALQWPDDKIKSHTTYKTDFPPHQRAPRTQPCGPKKAQLTSGTGNFQGETSYKMDFIPHETAPRFDPPWKPNRAYEKPDQAIENSTTYRRDFPCPPEDIVPEKGKGRQQNLGLSGDPMATVTTHRNDFIQPDGFQPVQSCKKVTPYAPPTAKFANQSTTRRDYVGMAGDRAFPIKHEGNLKTADGAMEITTTTHKDYTCSNVKCPAALLRLGDDTVQDQYKFVKAEQGHEYYHKIRKKRNDTSA